MSSSLWGSDDPHYNPTSEHSHFRKFPTCSFRISSQLWHARIIFHRGQRKVWKFNKEEEEAANFPFLCRSHENCFVIQWRKSRSSPWHKKLAASSSSSIARRRMRGESFPIRSLFSFSSHSPDNEKVRFLCFPIPPTPARSWKAFSGSTLWSDDSIYWTGKWLHKLPHRASEGTASASKQHPVIIAQVLIEKLN